MIDDNSSDSGTVFNRHDEAVSQSQFSQARSLGSKFRVTMRRDRLSHKGSVRSSLRGSVRSGSRRNGGAPNHNGNRVQVISDFGSEQSIDQIEQSDLQGINQEILEQEQQELINKRSNNNYDLMGLKDPKHEDYKEVHRVIQEYLNESSKTDKQSKGNRKSKTRKKELPKKIELKDMMNNSFFSENIKIYNMK